jgi:hypothetical protein
MGMRYAGVSELRGGVQEGEKRGRGGEGMGAGGCTFQMLWRWLATRQGMLHVW